MNTEIYKGEVFSLNQYSVFKEKDEPCIQIAHRYGSWIGLTREEAMELAHELIHWYRETNPELVQSRKDQGMS